MSIYRVYSAYKGLHLLKPKNKDKDYKIDSVEKVIELLESVIEEENAHYLVVESNIEQDTDIPYLSIWDKQEFYDFKNEYYKSQQTFVKRKGIR